LPTVEVKFSGSLFCTIVPCLLLTQRRYWTSVQLENTSRVPEIDSPNYASGATADYSDEMMHAALDINMPNYASAIVATREVVDAIGSF
jgi:hypothetical protein